MLGRLERGYQQLSQVSADMTHDLRTPIGQTEVALSQTHSVVDYLALHGELRADASHHQGSSGLGLSIVLSIMRLHQGSCEMHSEQGVNRFTLRFPY